MAVEICGSFVPMILRRFFHLAMFNNYAKDLFPFTARSCHLSCVFRSLYAGIANNWRLIVKCYITGPILQMKIVCCTYMKKFYYKGSLTMKELCVDIQVIEIVYSLFYEEQCYLKVYFELRNDDN